MKRISASAPLRIRGLRRTAIVIAFCSPVAACGSSDEEAGSGSGGSAGKAGSGASAGAGGGGTSGAGSGGTAGGGTSGAGGSGGATIPTDVIDADRITSWNPGILKDTQLDLPLGADGLPQRTKVCATVNPGGNLQQAITACPEGQVVALAA